MNFQFIQPGESSADGEVLTSSVYARNLRDMTEQELQAEWDYRYQERLGILCQSNTPPAPEQVEIATREADEAIRLLRGKS